jgi:hypothetical protein
VWYTICVPHTPPPLPEAAPSRQRSRTVSISEARPSARPAPEFNARRSFPSISGRQGAAATAHVADLAWIELRARSEGHAGTVHGRGCSRVLGAQPAHYSHPPISLVAGETVKETAEGYHAGNAR